MSFNAMPADMKQKIVSMGSLSTSIDFSDAQSSPVIDPLQGLVEITPEAPNNNNNTNNNSIINSNVSTPSTNNNTTNNNNPSPATLANFPTTQRPASAASNPIVRNPRLSTARTPRPAVSPRLKEPSKLTPERRQEVIRVLRNSIPIYAEKRRQQIAENAALARLWILDAFAGRYKNGLARNSTKEDQWIYWAFQIQTSEYLFRAVVLSSFLHTMSIFFEPAHQCSNNILLHYSQYIYVLIYGIDMGLKMYYEGRQVKIIIL
jgi:hypothetical protein